MKFRCENNYFQDLAYEQIKEGWKFYALLGRKLCSFMQRVALSTFSVHAETDFHYLLNDPRNPRCNFCKVHIEPTTSITCVLA